MTSHLVPKLCLGMPILEALLLSQVTQFPADCTILNVRISLHIVALAYCGGRWWEAVGSGASGTGVPTLEFGNEGKHACRSATFRATKGNADVTVAGTDSSLLIRGISISVARTTPGECH